MIFQEAVSTVLAGINTKECISNHRNIRKHLELNCSGSKVD